MRIFQVDVVFDRGEEGEEVLFKLETDEFFRAHVAQGFRPAGVALVPGRGDGLSEEVDPASVSRGEGKSIAKRRGRDVDGCVIKLASFSQSPPTKVRCTLMRISLYRSFCCNRRELVDPTMYDLVP